MFDINISHSPKTSNSKLLRRPHYQRVKLTSNMTLSVMQQYKLKKWDLIYYYAAAPSQTRFYIVHDLSKPSLTPLPFLYDTARFNSHRSTPSYPETVPRLQNRRVGHHRSEHFFPSMTTFCPFGILTVSLSPRSVCSCILNSAFTSVSLLCRQHPVPR